MKDSCCRSKISCSSWFCPSIVTVVVGVIMMTAGASKFLWGTEAMSWVGWSALGVFGLDTSVGGLATLALILGYVAATIELLGGLSFGLGCRKTSKYAAFALSLVMISALAVHITNLKPVNETGFKFFADILWQVQLPLLLSVIFMKKSSGILSCCKTKSCCDTQKSCCGGGECDK